MPELPRSGIPGRPVAALADGSGGIAGADGLRGGRPAPARGRRRRRAQWRAAGGEPVVRRALPCLQRPGRAGAPTSCARCIAETDSGKPLIDAFRLLLEGCGAAHRVPPPSSTGWNSTGAIHGATKRHSTAIARWGRIVPRLGPDRAHARLPPRDAWPISTGNSSRAWRSSRTTRTVPSSSRPPSSITTCWLIPAGGGPLRLQPDGRANGGGAADRGVPRADRHHPHPGASAGRFDPARLALDRGKRRAPDAFAVGPRRGAAAGRDRLGSSIRPWASAV